VGGFDLAAEWMGWENKFHCEWNPFGQKVLKHYWPNAELFTDITKSDFKKYHGAIDIISGGFPCQPYSAAGKRKGKEDERHLWPEMLRTIREVQPRWVVGENVFGLVNWSNGLVFHEVQADLEAAGYEVWPYVLAAAGVNAPHRRDRIWFVAHAGLFGQAKSRKRTMGVEQLHEGGDAANANASRWRESNKENEAESSKQFNGNSVQSINSDTNGNRLQGGVLSGSYGQQGGDRSIGFITEHLHTHGRETIQRGGWEKFPTQSPICFRNDGIPNKLDGITFPKWRNESIKAYGNAVVPQVVYQIFKAIEQYEQLNTTTT
jgi:DNA (cytosine-5)-methyltransferase 1